MASNWSYFPNNFDCVLRHAPPACFCILRKKSLRYMELYNLRQYTWWHAYIIIGLMYIWVAWFVYRIGVVSRFCSFAWCSIRWQFQVHNLEWKMSEFVCVYVRPCGWRKVEHTKYCLATSSVDSNLFSLARLIQSFSIATLIIWLNGERDLWLKMKRSWNLFFPTLNSKQSFPFSIGSPKCHHHRHHHHHHLFVNRRRQLQMASI